MEQENTNQSSSSSSSNTKTQKSTDFTTSPPSCSASKPQFHVEIKDHTNDKFIVFIETNTDDMYLIGFLYSVTKRAMLVIRPEPGGNAHSSSYNPTLWAFPFESPADFTALLARVKDKINLEAYKMWSMYALTSSSGDESYASLLRGYFLECTPLMGYSKGVFSFGSKGDMTTAEERAKEVGADIKTFDSVALSEYSVEFKIADTDDVSRAALEEFGEFEPRALMLEYNPFSKKYTGHGVVYFPSEDKRYYVTRKYSSESQPPLKMDRVWADYPFGIYYKNFDSAIGNGIIKVFNGYKGEFCSVAIDGKKMYGCVWFKRDEDRQKCISEMNGNKKYGEKAYVDVHRSKASKTGGQMTSSSSSPSSSLISQQTFSSSQQGPYKVFFSGFPHDATEESIKKTFSEWDVEVIEVKKDSDGKALGSGNVTFKNVEDMDAAIKKYNTAIIGSAMLKVERYDLSRTLKKECVELRSFDYYAVFITNLDRVEESRVMELFGPYHPIGMRIFKREYVTLFLSSKEDQLNAIRNMNGVALKSGGKSLGVKEHGYKGDFPFYVSSSIDLSKVQKRSYVKY